MGSRIMIGVPNRLNGAALSGGSWTAGLPLSNLSFREIAKVARTTGVTPDKATFTLDFGRPRAVRILAAIAHNISLSASIRYELAEDPAFTSIIYDATVDAWPGLLDAPWDIDNLEWEDDNFWLGGPTLEDIEGLTAVSAHIMPEQKAGQFLRVTINDPLNVDGYIELGRFFAGPAISPRVNYSWGGSMAYEIGTAVETSLGGAEYFDVREPSRVFRFTLDHLTDNEGYGTWLEMVRRHGIHGEVFVVPKPADAYNGLRRNFLGRIRQPGALEVVRWEKGGNSNSIAFEIKELR